MICPESFTKEHIQALQAKSHRDPLLLERAIYAFGLLEALVKVGLPFVFKGGTCLLLLLKEPRRLSTDIDILVKPDTALDVYLEKASAIFPFEQVEEQVRVGKNQIEKRHFKFTYHSPMYQKPFYILLDVLFEENYYTQTLEQEIRSDLLVTKPEYNMVEVPSVDCILADKLTAFAPHTIGILLGHGKDMEVMKQLYDVFSLLDVCKEFAQVRQTYNALASAEIAYRGISQTTQACLWDTFDACVCIASRGKVNSAEYPLYVKGIRDLRGHIYIENYSPEIAAIRSTKVMYLVMCLLTEATFEPVEDAAEYMNRKLIQNRLLPLRYLKKASLQAYAYLVKTDELMRCNERLTKERNLSV